MALVLREPTLLEKQRGILEDLEKTLNESTYTLDKPYLLKNPSKIAPLTALIAFETEKDEAFEISINSDFFLSTSKEKKHAYILWGLKEGLNEISFKSSYGKVISFHLEIDKLAEKLPIEVLGKASGKVFFMPLDGHNYPQVYDKEGRVRALLTEKLSYHFEALPNGHFLVGAPQRQLPPFESVDLWEMDFTGFIKRVIHLPSGLSGGFCALDNDCLVVVSESPYQGTVSDKLLWLNKNTGEILKEVYLRNHLKMQRSDIKLQTGSDWVRASRVIKDELSAEVLVMTSHIPSVLVFNYEGEFLRGEIKESLKNLVQEPEKWCFIPDEKVLELMPKKGKITNLLEGLSKDSARAYLSLQGITSGYQMNYLDKTRKGYALHQGAYGECSIAPFGSEACSSRRDSYISKKWVFSHLLPVASFGSYEIDESDFNFILPKTCALVSGELSPQPYLDVIFPISSEEPLDEEMALKLWHDGTRLYIRGSFYQGDAVVLELIGKEKTYYYYLEASLTPMGTSWFGGQGKGPERILHWSLPLINLKGDYQINLLVDDVRYLTEYNLVI